MYANNVQMCRPRSNIVLDSSGTLSEVPTKNVHPEHS